MFPRKCGGAGFRNLFRGTTKSLQHTLNVKDISLDNSIASDFYCMNDPEGVTANDVTASGEYIRWLRQQNHHLYSD